MTITPDQHRRIGEILGYPSCCVEEWVADQFRIPLNAAVRRGVIVDGLRTPQELDRISSEVSDLLGRPWEIISQKQGKAWVPCSACARAAA